MAFKNMKNSLILTILSLYSSFVFSQSTDWKDISNEKGKFNASDLKFRKSIPDDFKLYEINFTEFKEKVFSLDNKSLQVIELPTAKGVQKFSVKEASSLAQELSLKYPMIKSYVAKGIDNPSAVARFSFGTDGFHAVIFYAGSPSFYIDPYSKDYNSYIAYSRSTLSEREQDFSCDVEEQLESEKVPLNSQRNADDGLLRTFRLALVCTGEYAQYHLNDQGISDDETDAVKKAAVLSAMNTSMTRVNGVYEKDLGVRMEIIANNDEVIFLDPNTDGLSNTSGGSLLGQTQSICDNVIGNANYDIGHVFSTGGGGVASLGVVCVSGSKARGVTGSSNPTADPYDIDYVAHEIGHQFGATHTQNNSCNRTNSTAVEPGSASTIMGYAGICPPNVQSNSDDHFHSVSINQMWNLIQSSATCADATSTGNTAPVITPGSDYSIPKSTPFVLKGVASDVDANDNLSYNWEQIDNEIATMPPSSTSTGGPAFRSKPSSSSPNRYMPALSTVIGGSLSSTWEVVPTVARDMNFSLVVRDNAFGGGNSARDDVKITTVDITPFTVDGPTTNEEWDVGSTKNIIWVVGSTDTSPVNCSTVNILLSTDGGLTFPIMLAANTPNDGSASIVVPNQPTNSARIMVEAADNVFYNVNDTNFTISASDPTFVASNTTGSVDVCNNNGESAVYNISLDFVEGFSETVSFTASGQPTGSSVSFNPTSINTNGIVELTVSNLDGAAPDTYNININASSTSITRNLEATLNVSNGVFDDLNLTSPEDDGTGIGLTPTFTWDVISNATSYDIQIATDPSFSSTLVSENVNTNSYSGVTLEESTTYYWRVKAKNSCGEGDFSVVNSFTTQTCSHCTSSGDMAYATSITRVILNDIDNVSGKDDPYSDYTNISTDVTINDSYDLTVQVNTDGNYTVNTIVWIDWNQDCDFDDTNEQYDLGSATNTPDGPTSDSPLSITVPSDAILGSTKMRVSTRYNTDPFSCMNNVDGEVEDYTINVVDDTASIDDFVFEGFNLYPNPSNGNFNLMFDTVSSDFVQLQLFDITGRLIREIRYQNITQRFSESISFDATSAGFYLLKITNGTKQTTRKIVIE